ncbi:MAG: GntR family transcriptional regulator / MocR family aminotransferase [Actinomycetota bacterium]|jgi:GntR family transcriptional regulator/MocR family aminotransferase|nr:GntR family transcriptional regulator / MocR family aminotransferase [Actinomycetota bacterium]
MTGTSTNSRLAGDLLVELRRDVPMPLHRQIGASIRDGIRSGRLPLGTSLPPSRTVAADLGVSRGVVVEAYQQLVAEGYLTSRAGGYTQVAIGPEPAPVAERPAAPAPRIDFGYGRADVSSFPRAAWLRSVRRVLTEAPSERFGYLTGRGVPELHNALADYLNRVRGTSAPPGNIVICNGYAQGIALLVQVLAKSGAKRIAVEDPSAEDDVRPLAAAAGLGVVGVPVGHNGICVDLLERTEADAVILTPSHQWPTGGVLPAESRAAVLDWAARRGALVIEDDYDAEYRYDRAPIGAMQGLAPDQVAYAGTASKTLAPGLRLGWLVLPGRLVDDVAAAKLAADRGSPVLDQLTFADFLSHGEFDRHLRRMRPVYRKRRDALLKALRDHVPEFEPAGVSAGLHLVTWLPPGIDEAAVVRAAARRGLGLYGLMPYRLSGDGPSGLIFGYATLSERTIDEGIAVLASVIGSL